MNGFGEIGKIEPRDPSQERAALLFLGEYAHRADLKRDECLELVQMLDLEDSFRTIGQTILSA